ncbi:MAG: hypothetical protein ACKN9T_07395 [Candidatus Methylumidiphilus sp.]
MKTKRHTPVPFRQTWATFGLGLAVLALASSPAGAASTQAKGKTHAAPPTSASPAPIPTPQPVAAPATLAPPSAAAMEPPPAAESLGFIGAAVASVTGDVYGDPSRWQALSFQDLFRTGWDQAWVSPPTGAGGAPRHGWNNANDGVFYRLSVASFGWQHGPANNTDGYTGTLTSYTPLSQRLEIRTDISLASSRGPNGHSDTQTNFGDFVFTPRILLSESRAQTQSLDIAFRTPTGNSFNGNSVAAINPQYNFWTNYWKGLVVCGGLGFSIPYGGEIAKAGARSTFNTNLDVGYYLTPHDAAPFGDLVFYVTNTLIQAIDTRGPSSTTTFSIGPGFRSHLGDNWYLLGAVDFAVTKPEPYDYQVFGGIMKVY